MNLRRLQRALTLIELTIVLLVLAAVAGIIVPRLTGYGERAHGATTASSMQETAKALSLFEANKGRMPNNWDNLIDVNGGSGTGLPASLTDTGITPALTAGTLASAAEAQVLTDAGIQQVYSFDSTETTFDATFLPYDGGATPTATAVADTMPIAVVPNTVFGFSGSEKVVALGIGRLNEMVNEVMTDAPVVFEGELQPNAAYLRLFVAFQILDNAGNPLPKARPLGVFKVEPADGSIAGAGTHLQVYYEARNQ